MGAFDDILATVPAEDRAVLDRYPALRDSMTRIETERDQFANYAGGWKQWQDKFWDPTAKMTKREVELARENEALKTQIEGAVASGDAEELKRLRAEFQTNLENIRTASAQQTEGMHMFYESVSRHLLQHRDEFGQNLDPKAFREFMVKNNIMDPDVAYDRMVADQRKANSDAAAAKQKTEFEEALAKARTEGEQAGYQRRSQEQAMGPQGMSPTDHTGGIVGVTSAPKPGAGIPDAVKEVAATAKPGDGTLAQLGYQMYIKGELPTQ